MHTKSAFSPSLHVEIQLISVQCLWSFNTRGGNIGVVIKSLHLKRTIINFTVIWRHSSVDKLQELFGCGLHGLLGALHDQRLKTRRAEVRKRAVNVHKFLTSNEKAATC